MDEELKPCPFCGSKVLAPTTLVVSTIVCAIRCSDCGCMGPKVHVDRHRRIPFSEELRKTWDHLGEKAIKIATEKWNKRA